MTTLPQWPAKPAQTIAGDADLDPSALVDGRVLVRDATAHTFKGVAQSALSVEGFVPAIGVKDSAYGAKGDGATDDTAAIQAALDAANTAGGGLVVLPKGTYVVSSLTPHSNVRLMGVGGSVLQHKTGTTNPLIYRPSSTVGTLSRFTATGIHFEGEAAPLVMDAQVAVYLRGGTVSDPRVTDCTFNGFVEGAVYIGECTRTQVRGNNVTNCATHVAGRNAINVVAQTGTDQATFGEIVVNGNVIDNTATGAIAVVTIGAGYFARVAITGNVVRNATGWAGIACESNSSHHQATISGNTLIRCLKGIVVANTGGSAPAYADFRSYSITGNTIDCEDLAGTTGVQLGASNAVVVGNSIRSTGSGVIMGGTDVTHRASSQLVADNMLVCANAAGSASAPYMVLGSWADDCTVAGNRIVVESGATGRSINLTDTNRLHVHANHVTAPDRDGILLQGGAVDAVVEGNVILDPNAVNSTFSGVTVAGAVSSGTTPSGLAVRNNIIVDRRGSPQMRYAVDVSGVTGGGAVRIVHNTMLGWVTDSINGRANVTVNDRNIVDSVGWHATDDFNGQPGALAPSSRGWALTTVTLVSGRGFYARFVPRRDMTVTKIGFSVATLDAADPAIDVGIYDSSLNQIVHSGATTGKLTATGSQSVTITSTTLKAGTVYYIGISSLSGTAALIAASVGNAQATRIFGSGAPNQELGISSTDTHEPLPATANIQNATACVVLAVRES